MDCKKVGSLIYTLRKEKGMTQKEIADLMNISDKTISKWERGLGCPDVSLLSALSKILGVNIEEILLGGVNPNDIVGGNMKRIKFYVCPQCGNLLTATGEPVVSCCGRKLNELTAEKANEEHKLNIEHIEDELYVSAEHEMTKDHYISFAAFATGDKVFLVKQYPEWGLQFRLPKFGHGKLFFYCTKHGLYYQLI
ncbi:helix-turn-helix domain-containing protein [Anaerovorax sp. IOR16]|uniref:helix-turn-helix domain-containing protein n=1 Tax=Anaerovorax sp. IOR16 TaxID=2773458 RepID=UPI0019D31499|nr:helix-turn-helix domain-containing protein [Anaerovorax sp. IOR16]